MSESKLVSYTNLTKNKTTMTDKKNLYIIPHVFVGQVTVKNGVDHFTTNCNASCQYVIGVDGSIGQCVSESDRAWTTGGNKEIKNNFGLFVGGSPTSSQKSKGFKGIDFEAVTIEMACEPKAPYVINDKVYNSLVNLMADIAIRNNMGELKWKADPQLVGNQAEQNILVHRWFANKACPGDYVYSHLGDICDKANDIIRKNNSTSKTQSTIQVVNNEQYIWDKLNSDIKNDFGTAGVIGNLYAESGLRANNLQNTFEKKFGLTDEEYTHNVDNKIISREQFIKDKSGYGIAQWTYWSRKQNLYDYIKTRNKSIADLQCQLEFLLIELKQYKDVWAILQTTKSIKQASDVILTQFERPADQSETMKDTREKYSRIFFEKYVDREKYKVSPTSPFYDKTSETVYTVKKGDTLSGIAKKFNTTYQKIAKDNGIDNPSLITVGQKLVIK